MSLRISTENCSTCKYDRLKCVGDLYFNGCSKWEQAEPPVQDHHAEYERTELEAMRKRER